MRTLVILLAVSVALVTAGVALLSVPAGLIVAGVLLAVLSLVVFDSGDDEAEAQPVDRATL